MTVMPSRPATSLDALSSADATPDRSGGIECRTTLVSGTFISPAPAPNSRKPGIRPPKVAAPPSRATRYRPTVMSCHAECHRPVRADPWRDLWCERREECHADCHRYEREARLGGREAEDRLQVDRGEEVDTENPEGPQHHHRGAAAEDPGPEQLHRHHRRLRPQLDASEDRGRDGRDREAAGD